MTPPSGVHCTLPHKTSSPLLCLHYSSLHHSLQNAMEDEFFFSLLRISVAQILKALGFDKCKPSVLNIVTDLYIQYLRLLVQKAQKFATVRTSCPHAVDVPDVFQAFLATGTMRPLRFGSTDRKPCLDDTNTRSGEAFLLWLRYSDQYAVSRRLSEVPPSLIHNLMEKRREDTSSETDQERKKRRIKERQDFYNQLKQGEDATAEAMGGYVDDLDDDEISAGDRLSWLTYLAQKDLKLGHNLKFVNSCLQDSLMDVQNNPRFHPKRNDADNALLSFQAHILNNTRSDYYVLQVHDADDQDASVFPSLLLKELLPYNVKYDLVLCDDRLELYIAYATAHRDEIQSRLEDLRAQCLEVNGVDAELAAELDADMVLDADIALDAKKDSEPSSKDVVEEPERESVAEGVVEDAGEGALDDGKEGHELEDVGGTKEGEKDTAEPGEEDAELEEAEQKVQDVAGSAEAGTPASPSAQAQSVPVIEKTLE